MKRNYEKLCKNNTYLKKNQHLLKY